ncbi:SIR2 family NAD-dependent protein deacylase [Calycomorphotria hydatis]|uniref:protein acetyllysine N-acetyltransferase n=1 Tax=Calycomorphotria hydatis TaxID=2528027 RepID=A0A517T3T8_9PLAN|nr:Sir2 family NAD-dependent protein deacetylase [Calycomorphotria hydatis]QDT63029.1 NAD-dependent protein deacylase [Calycomorphotria hydatis]
MDKLVSQAASAISSAEVLFITAGAGMGVDSGLPDFRGNEGFWRAYPALREEKVSFSKMANPRWFSSDPKKAWGFYGHRHHLYRNTEPHEGFNILKKWADSKSQQSFIFTSNVDGHFRKAGFSDNQILECHGSIQHLQCTSPCSNQIWHVEELDLEVDHVHLIAKYPLPTCPHCGSVARPNILMFNDWDWIPDRTSEQEKHYQNWVNETSSLKKVAIEIGAGNAIPTVRMESESSVGQLVRINPTDAQGPLGTISIAQSGLAALKAIDKMISAECHS